MGDSNPLLEIRGWRKRYAGFSLEIGSLSVLPGDIVGLVGPNGAGKTTLLRSMLGIVRADAGEIFFDGRSIPSDSTELRVRTGYVPEEAILYEAMSVSALLNFVGRFYPTWNSALATALPGYFGLDPSRRVRALSKGMRAKLMLIAAVCHAAELLVLDEPTAGLDPPSREEFWEFVHEMFHRGRIRALLLSTHQLEDVAQICNRVVFFRDGKVQLDRREIDAGELRRLFLAGRPVRTIPWN